MKLFPETQQLAQLLLDSEMDTGKNHQSSGTPMFRASEMLRRSLSTVIGAADYRLLVSRALILAKTRSPSLHSVRINPEGSLERVAADLPNVEESNDGGLVFIAEVLRLFIDFVGAALMLQLLPDLAPQLKADLQKGENLPSVELLHEVSELHRVSDRLVRLANTNRSVEAALMSVSGNIRHTAAALEIFVRIKDNASGTSNSSPDATSIRYLM